MEFLRPCPRRPRRRRGRLGVRLAAGVVAIAAATLCGSGAVAANLGPRLDPGAGVVVVAPRPAVPPGAERAVFTDFGADAGFVSWFPAGHTAPAPQHRYGSGALDLLTDGDGRPTAVERSLAVPLDVSMATVWLDLRVDHPDRVSELWFQVTSDDWTHFRTYHLETRFQALDGGVWLTMAATRDDSDTTRGFDPRHVTHLRIRATDTGAGPLTLTLDRLTFVRRATSGAVSITFDDGWRSQYTVAAPILEGLGWAATAYVIPYQVGTAEYMDLTMLQTLYARGWDVAGHYHPSLQGRVDPELGHIVDEVHRFLDGHGFTRSAGLFAYPQGYFDEPTVIPALRRAFTSGRTIRPGLDPLPPADPMRLRVLEILPTTRDAELQRALDTARRDALWLILVYHRLVPDPAYPTEVTPAAFRRQMALVADAKIPVLPVSRVLERSALHGGD